MFLKVRHCVERSRLSYPYIRRLTPTFDHNHSFLSTRPKMEDPNSTPAPTTYGSATDASFLAAESTGSAPGSFQNDGILSGGADSTGYDAEFGFQRPEFGQEKIAGTVQIYDRHVFLCYKTPQVWPANVEAAEFDRLPRLLSAALKARKGDMRKRTRLTICEGEDGTESSNGDVLIFPDMSRYRRLTHFDVDNFVEETLVKDAEWLPGAAETLVGSFIFVCSHGSRDKRCGVCGPLLIKKFKKEINSRGLQDQISVSPCSHIGGHKYAGNVIIFSPNADGNVTGHWYGYVSPDDVPALIEQHIGRGEILPHLWRGQMGLSEDEQKKAYDRLQLNGDIENVKIAKDIQTDTIEVTNFRADGCCQGNGNSSCCQSISPEEKLQDYIEEVHDSPEAVKKSSKASKVTSGSKGASTRKICALPTWFECWEREDTYATLAVVAAAVSVGIAYGCYKHLK